MEKEPFVPPTRATLPAWARRVARRGASTLYGKGTDSMDKQARKHGQRELDRFLPSIPDRLRELFETVNYDAALQKLTEAGEPTPKWVAAQLRSLRIKTRTIETAVLDLAETLERLLAAYTEAGGTDSQRIAHAQAELLFLRQTAEKQAAQRARLAQIQLLNAQSQTQAEALDALAVEQLRQRLQTRDAGG